MFQEKTKALAIKSVDAISISDAEKMYASAMGVSANSTKIYSGASLTNKISALAACSTPNNKLVLALGGLWNDAYYPLKDGSIRENVYAVGITGSSLDRPFEGVKHILKAGQTPCESANTDACDAFKSVYGDTAAVCAGLSSISNTSTFGIGKNDFNGIFANTNIPGNAIYNNCLKPFLINSVEATAEVAIRIELDSSGPHRLRIADYGAFALGADLDSVSNLYTQNFLNTDIKEALRKLPGITASCG